MGSRRNIAADFGDDLRKDLNLVNELDRAMPTPRREVSVTIGTDRDPDDPAFTGVQVIRYRSEREKPSMAPMNDRR